MEKFKLVYMSSKDNVVDLLTKALLRDITYNFTLDLELWNIIGNRRDINFYFYLFIFISIAS